VAASGKDRHRDRAPGWRQAESSLSPSAGRVFRITDAERQQVAKALRYIDEARSLLESQQNAANREIVRELKASADRIFDLMNELDELEAEPREP
jgi:hypothetical protein